MAHTTEAKESTATVRIVYRSYDILRDGTSPFFICITKDRKRKYVATGLTLHPDYWDAVKEKIKRNYPHELRKALEKDLIDWRVRYEQAAETLGREDERHDASAVAERVAEGRRQKRSVKLMAFFEETILSMIKANQSGTADIYRDTSRQIAAFIEEEYKRPDVTFEKVSVRFCNELETYLRSRGNSDNTINQRFRTLRAIYNRAIGENVATLDKYPFARSVADKHKFSISKFSTVTQKRAISREDVRKVEAFQPVGTTTVEKFNHLRNKKAIVEQKNAAEVDRLQLAKNVFLFSFYGGGINFVDLVKLRWRDLATDAAGGMRLTYVRQKTGGKFSLKLLGPALAIVESYRPLTCVSPDAYIFPILDYSRHLTAGQINNRVHKMLGQINPDLKTIGERAKIETPLTTYTARHSFATSLRRSGVATAVISQAMGHRSEAVTAVYLDSFASETVDSAFDTLL